MSGKNGATPIVVEDYALTLAQERLVVDAQVAVHLLLRRAGLTRSDLAKLLGARELNVDRMLSGNAHNLTLRSLARIFHVLGTRCRVVYDADMRSTEAAEAAKGNAVASAADFEPVT